MLFGIIKIGIAALILTTTALLILELIEEIRDLMD